MRLLHEASTPDGGLAVGISRRGIHVTQVDDVTGYAGFRPGQFLKISNVFSWDRVRSRPRVYAGDTGRGPMADRLIAAGISLLAYSGGSKEITDHVDLSLPA